MPMVDTGGFERVQGSNAEAVKYLRDDMRDFFDTDMKNANSLLVAHGAGLVGCLSTLKDYTPTSPYAGIGLFISLFVIGFIFACTGIINLHINRTEILTWVTHGGVRPKIKSKVSTFALSVSVLCLFVNLALIGLKFYKL
jgi:hypothetical protein